MRSYDAAVLCRQDGVSRRIEVGKHVVALPARRREFLAQPRFRVSLRAYPKIVLNIAEVLPLAVAAYQVIGKLHLAGKAEDEVGQIVTGGIVGDGAIRGQPELRAGGLTETGRNRRSEPVDRVDIHHFRVNDAHFEPVFEGLAAANPGIVHFRIPGGRILKLRVSRLPADDALKSRRRFEYSGRR